MNILYLYTEIMGYNLPIFDHLANDYGAMIHVVRWTNKKNTPFHPNATSRVKYYDRSLYSKKELCELASSLNPSVVYISGWQDKGYLPVARELKAKGVPVVMGLDSQWVGSARQRIGAKLIRHVYKKRYFSFAWVPGPLQYEYAARIGFSKSEIICNLLSGNTELFSRGASALDGDKSNVYPKQFLYVGRFVETKGIDILIEAYSRYKNVHGGDWKLKCIGNGPMEKQLLKAQQDDCGITVESFAEQPALVDYAIESGAFVLPSRYEPWGVVAHEFASAGLPLILSDAVGSKLQFLVSSYNGYEYPSHSAESLALAMYSLSLQPEETLLAMGKRSAHLGLSLCPKIAAASLISVLKGSVDE